MGVLAVLVILVFLAYEKMQEKNLTFKDVIFKSAYGVYIVLLSCISIPIALFIIYAIFISPIIAMFGMM